jgi:signal transduction histidine kinase
MVSTRSATEFNLPMHDLVVSLSRAQTLRSMADAIGTYCGKAFRSPAGMIFVEREGRLQLLSQWHSRQIPKKQFAQQIIREGLIGRAFKSAKPVFWRRQSRSITVLPILAAGRRPIGVMAVVVPPAAQITKGVHDSLVRFAQIFSGCIARVRAYDDALAARDKAVNAAQSKDEFLSMLSHELKNPMMPIMGWAVALSSGTLPAEKQNLALEGIVRNVRALNYLIEDLFDAVSISSGKLRLQSAEVRIQDVAREALTAIQPGVEAKKLRVSTDIAEAIPAFMADGRRLQQVLVNLLNNAVKFTPEGGSIALRVRMRNDFVECIVSDTGKGIERKFLPFVFERFRQENRPSKGHAPGLGLGLAIVREIVELHDGSIEAFSDGTDKGSTFILRLPLNNRRLKKHFGE